MKKKNNNFRRIILPVAIVVWALMSLMVGTALAENSSKDYNCFRITASSSQSVSVEVTATGVKILAYGQTTTTDACSGAKEDSTVDVTITVENTGVKDDGSVRGVTFNVTPSGTKSGPTGQQTLDANNTKLTYTATSGKGENVAATILIDFANIQQESLGSSVDTVVKYVANATVSVDGTVITADTTFTNPDDKVYTLTAEPAEGYHVYGWRTADGFIDTTGAATISYPARNAATIWPQIIKNGSAMYMVNGSTEYYGFLDEAIAAANSTGTIIVVESGTAYHSLGEKEITIPSGVTLLVPYDGTYSTSTQDTSFVGDSAATGAFCTLTIEEGFTLKVEKGGSLVVNSRIAANGGGNHEAVVYGTYGKMVVNGTLDVSGSLYARGYIVDGDHTKPAGDAARTGRLYARSTSDIHVLLQLIDYRGGSASLAIYKKVFPLNNYAFSNIMIRSEYELGAVLKARYAVGATVPLVGQQTATDEANLLGTTNAYLFQMSGGTFIMDYQYSSDKMLIELRNTTITMNDMTVKASAAGQTLEMTTEGKQIPVGGNLNLIIGENATFESSKSLKFLPGFSVRIENGGTMNISGSAYLYSKDQFITAYSNVAYRKKLNVSGLISGSNGTASETNSVITVKSGGTLNVTGTLLESTGHGGGIVKDCGSIVNYASTATSGSILEPSGTTEDPATNANWQQVTIVDTDTHTWVEGNCTTPKTCSVCNATTGSALGHTKGQATFSWTGYEVCTATVTCSVCNTTDSADATIGGPVTKKEPTCTTAGEVAYTAAVTLNGHEYTDTKTDIVDALGHNMQKTADAVAPTCETTGSTAAYTCANGCGKTEGGETIDALGHDMQETSAAVAPTCEIAGSTAAYTCANGCGKSEGGEVVPAYGHTPGDDDGDCTTPITCKVCNAVTTAGKAQHTPEADDNDCTTALKCAECGTVITPAANAHTPENDDNDCTTALKCSVCQKVITEAAQDHELSPWQYATNENQHWQECTNEGCVHKTTPVACVDGDDNNHSCDTCQKPDVSGHSWIEADCDTPKTCSVCSEIEGEANGHSYDDGVVTTDPTCDLAGVKTYTCAACGGTYTEEVTALGHTEETVAHKDATCTEAGVVGGTYCTRCNEGKAAAEATIDALGHTEVIDAAVDATCTETGLTEGKHCSVCDEILVAQEVVDALGHTEVIDAAVDATCTATGLTEGSHCDVCGEVLVAQTVVAALGHTEVIDEAVAPTCTETGLTEGKHCSVCGEVLVAQETVAALGHTEVIDAAVAPDCTNTGLTEGKHCSVCGEVLVAQETVDALGHTEVIDTAVAPDCTNTGLTEGKHCSVCGEVLVAQETVDALGHTEVVDAAVAATCTETGLTEGKHCDVCGEVLVAQTVVDALGHTEVIDAAVAPDCTNTGLTEGKHCSVCNEVLVAQNVVDALGHTEVIDEAVDATCTETGLTEGKHCSVCGEVIVAQEVVEALGHTEVVDAAVAPTCTETGLTEGKHCSVCNEVLVAQETVDALGHTEVIDAAVAPTCTATGLTEGKHCSVCDEVLVAQTVVDALGHTEVIDEAVAATCTTTGLTEGKHCSVCGEVIVAQEVVEALGHTEVIDAAVAPTCTETGLTEGKHCSVCGEVIVAQEVVEALGHTEVIDAAVAPDCTNTGLTEGKHCSVCDEVLVAQNVVDALGHTEVIDEAVDATCTTTGLTEGKHCSVCDEVLVAQNVVDALGHTEVIDEAVDATCTTTGLTEGKHCSVCGEVIVAQEEIAALGHTEVIDAAKAPTCTETGLTEGKHCSVCGEVLVAQTVVAALGHTEVIDAAVAPTCTATGLTEGKHCSVCGEVLVAQEEVPALGHTEVIDEAVAPTCTATGLTEGKHCSVCNEVLVAQTVVDALGHTHGAVQVENASEANCLFEGSYDNVSYCTVCGEEVSRETVTVPKTSHKFEVVEIIWSDADGNYTCKVKGECRTFGCEETTTVDASNITTEVEDATCTEDGKTVCTATFTEAWVATQTKTYPISAKDHSAAEAVVENCVESTCTVAGSYESVVYCSVCKAEMSRTKVDLALAAHTEEILVAVAPTCTTTGLTEGKKCSVCGEILKAQVEIPAKHTLEKVEAKAATCTEDGNIEHWKCTVCDKLFRDENGETLATEEDVEIPAGHKDEAPKDHVCDVCKENLGECEDKDGDKLCDICEESMVKGVAQIGEIIYENLEDALNAAKNLEDPTITLLANIEGEVTISQAVTIIKGEFAFEYTIEGCYKAEMSEDGKNVTFVESHTPGEAKLENIKEATSSEDGSYDSVVRCTICDTVVNTESYILEKGFIAGVSMTMTSNLTLNFVVPNAKVTDGGYYAVIVREYSNGSENDVVVVEQKDWTRYNSSMKKIPYSKLAAKEMIDVVHVYLYDGDGTLVAVRTSSIRDYAMLSIAAEEKKAEANRKMATLVMCVDMLNYGAAAQLNFGYAVDDLATSLLNDAQMGYATDDVTDLENVYVQGYKCAGTNLTLASNISLNFVFKNTDLADGMYATLTYTDHYGNEHTETFTRSEFTRYNSSMSKVTPQELAVADGKTVITCTVYNADGTVFSVSKDSVESNILRANNSVSTTESARLMNNMLLRFSRAAKEYFV